MPMREIREGVGGGGARGEGRGRHFLYEGKIKLPYFMEYVKVDQRQKEEIKKKKKKQKREERKKE